MKTALAIVTLLASSSVVAAQANWTGKQRQVQTVTYQWVWECEYDLYGRKFTKLFRDSCPSMIQVE